VLLVLSPTVPLGQDAFGIVQIGPSLEGQHAAAGTGGSTCRYRAKGALLDRTAGALAPVSSWCEAERG
jgi:hypothetical protein